MRLSRAAVGITALSIALCGGVAFGQATIEISDADVPGTIEVRLLTGGNDIAGTENEILFGPEVQLTGCQRNEAIGREATAFSFTPSGCTEGQDCSGLKVLVLSFSNLQPIPDGSVLYSCNVTADAAAAPGEYPLECEAPGASDPAGNSVDTGCADGVAVVADTPAVEIFVGSATGAPGDTVQIDISLNLLREGVEVAGTENVLNFASEAQILGCEVNPEIDRGATAFAFSPQGCAPGGDCSSVKALVLSFTNLSAIPNGSVLYTCEVGLAGGTSAAVVSGATGSFPITCSEPGASDPDGNPLTTVCSDGTVTIEEPATPTPEPTSTNTPDEQEPTATPTEVEEPATPTAAPPTNTPTSTPRGPSFDDDGCAVTAPRDATGGWMLLLPMAAMLWLRRRTR